MRGEAVLATMGSTEFFGVILFVFAVIFPPFDDVAEVDLSFHMLQHVIVVFAGAAIAYPLFKRGLARPRTGWTPNAILFAAVVAIVYWHLPASWDAAVLNPLVHAAEHLTFLLVGFAIGSFLQALSDSAKIAALFAAFFGHMAYATILVAPWNIQVYPLFSVADQAALGWTLLLTGWGFLVGVAYIIRGNPAWLQGFTGKQGPKPAPESMGARRRRAPSRMVSSASSVLILALAIYFASTGLALAVPSGPPQGGAVVYIVETPITWQYSPQDIVVVVGVNNTVTWLSRSTSYDTITSDSGLFASGLIQPGGSFSHTFAAPGVYAYHCVFHPWMVGKVVVKAR